MDERFQFFAPLSFFEKSDAPPGERRRIAGLVSTESVDREGEKVLQRGLNFKNFTDFGWFNDNHSRSQTDVLGYPDAVRFVNKGEKLPDGRVSPSDGHWAEGSLIEGHKKADEIWDLGRALQKTGGKRRLGFSIEGKILKRAGYNGKTIAEADVSNVAITHCPVNTDTGLITLVKAFHGCDVDESAEEKEEKALTVGTSVSVPGGPTTGAGAGRVLGQQSLLGQQKRKPYRLSRDEAVKSVIQRYPNIREDLAHRAVAVAFELRDRGILGV